MMLCLNKKSVRRTVTPMADKKVKIITPEAVIKKRRSDLNVRQGWIDLFVRIAVVLLAVWLLTSCVFLICQADGISMFPAVKDGDLIFSYRLQKKYEKNDVVIFETDGKRRVGRILAFEYDVVSISQNGVLSVNGTAQQGKIMYPTYPKNGVQYPYRVPEGCCFILCDYRTRCEDSRDFGAVSMNDVKSKVITILRRQDL